MSKNRRKLLAAGWIITLSLVTLSVATYAWMTIATSFRVSDLELSIITENAMEIALDQGGKPGEWTTFLDMKQLLTPETELRPVTWSAKDQTFYAPHYGLDGRISFLEPIPIASLSNGTLPPSADEAEKGEGAGYLLTVDLWVRTGTSQVTVYLSEPDTVSEGRVGTGTYVVGAPVWDANSVSHKNGGNGAENAIRIGFRSYDETYEKGKFVIYEPNAPTGGSSTMSIDGTTLEGDGVLIQQGQSGWSEQDPVLHGSVNYQMGQFLTDSNLFTLQNNTPRRFTVYIWLEGQDADCSNRISAGEIIANLQFGAITGNDHEDIVRPQED